MSETVIFPEIAKGFYSERLSPTESTLDRALTNAIGNAMRVIKTRTGRFQGMARQVNVAGESLRGMSDKQLTELAEKTNRGLKVSNLKMDDITRIFSLVREFADRRLGMRHFDEQILGGLVLLNGMVAEMETGEGKTLTATLPACTAALSGVPVHIITVNDYLARRDAEWMRPVYEAFGLRVGVVTSGMSLEDRRKAYHCDVTYCTNKEIVFDYLKDRLLLGQRPGHIQMLMERLHTETGRLDQLLLRGLSYAIVDEADNIFIDEARTPLIISGHGNDSYERSAYHEALELSDKLQQGKDYLVNEVKKTIDLTEQGKMDLAELSQSMGGIWTGKQRREEIVHQALTAKHLFTRDKDYIVTDNKIQIVDEYTGRTMKDRSWEMGLHQIIEAKEGCDITRQNETVARISYQRFFRRYHHLAGMTGTAKEVNNELWSVYRLHVVSIPTHRPLKRTGHQPKIFRTEQEKWNKIVETIAGIHGQGRPVLIGTRSVAASEYLSNLLTKANLPHQVLNARQDEQEAKIISQAGKKAQITVATNMAGRGTDIILSPGVKELGGLYVLATEFHDAKRIDRQLFGRCGRQGDPGSFECIASLEDDIFVKYMKRPVPLLVSRFVNPHSRFSRFLGKMFASSAQRMAQRRYFQIRKHLLKFDESLESAMAFSGRSE